MLIDILFLSLMFSIFVGGITISFRLLGFADLTIEGSFTLGGAVCAVLLSNGTNPVLSMLIAIIMGSIAGLGTASIHCFLKINKLLSGIIVLSMLYSVNLLVMTGPNVPLRGASTVFHYFDSNLASLLFMFIITALIFVILWWFLSTKFGLFLRATGENEKVVIRNGYHRNWFIITGLVISNGLIALSGAFFAQKAGAGNVNMGVGMLITMLASMIAGEKLIKPDNIIKLLLAAFVGAFLFQAVIGLALRFDIDPVYVRLLIAITLLFFLLTEKLQSRKGMVHNIGSDFI